jgi:hypothetical protein
MNSFTPAHKTFANFLVGLFVLSSISPEVKKHTAAICKQHPKPSYLIVFKSMVRFLFADATGVFHFLWSTIACI